MKKALLFLIPLTILTLASCKEGIEQRRIRENGNVIIEKKLTFENKSTVYKYEENKKKLNTYYFNKSNIPYVSIVDLVEAVDYYETAFIEKEDNDFYLDLDEYSKHIKIDKDENKMYVYDFDFYSVDDMEYKYVKDYQNHLQMTVEELDEDIEEVINLSDYNLEIKEVENKLVLPFHVISSLFSLNSYYYIYYTGYGYVGYSLDDGNYTAKNVASNVKYDDEFANYQYNYLRFLLNELYGLKFYNKPNVDSLLEECKDEIMARKTSFQGLNRLIGKLDDMHVYSFGYQDYFSSSYSSYSGPKKDAARKLVGDLFLEYYTVYNNYHIGAMPIKATINGIETKAMIIPFDEFKINSTMKEVSDGLLFARESGINNIILDVSLNGGGDTFALAEVLGLMTNDDILQETFNVRSGHTLTERFKVDANEDGDFTDLDAFTDMNFYVLSSGYSFSCANEFINYCKKHNLAKIIGQKSGGGGCAISPAITPFGSLFYYSSLNGMKDSNGILSEDGIDVDYEISYDEFYNKEALIKAIKNV